MCIKWQSNYSDKTCDYKENVFFNTQFCSDWVLTTGLRCLIYDFHMSGRQSRLLLHFFKMVKWSWGSLAPCCVEIDAGDGSRYTACYMRWYSHQVFCNVNWASLLQRQAVDTKIPSSHRVLAQCDRVQTWLPILQCRLSTTMNETSTFREKC